MVAFILSNSLIASLSGLKVEKINIADYLDTTANLYHYIEEVSIRGDLTESVTIQGWAFGATKADNKEKMIKLIFSSDEDTYAVTIGPDKSKNAIWVQRNDLYRIDNNIKGLMHGFIVSFSTLEIKNGEYTMYVYIKENGQDYGIVNTERKFIKANKEFREL